MALDTYPIDPTGTSIHNLVLGEPHILPVGKMRVIAPKFGAFHAVTLQVLNADTNQALPPEQYYAVWRYKTPTAKFKKDICGLVVIKAPDSVKNVRITYQVLGGSFSVQEKEVAEMIQRRVAANRPDGWGELLPPPPALQNKDFMDDEFGFATLENVLDDVARSIVNGCIAAQDEVLDYVEEKAESYPIGNSPDILAAMTAHTNAADPHPYYLRKTELADAAASIYAAVRRPQCLSPAPQAVGVSRTPLLTGSAYRALYGLPQKALHLQVATDAGFTALVMSVSKAAVGVSHQLPNALATKTRYYWRVRYQNIEDQWSPWSLTSTFTTA